MRYRRSSTYSAVETISGLKTRKSWHVLRNFGIYTVVRKDNGYFRDLVPEIYSVFSKRDIGVFLGFRRGLKMDFGEVY